MRTDGGRVLSIYEIPLEYCMATALRHVIDISLHVATDVRLTDAYNDDTNSPDCCGFGNNR